MLLCNNQRGAALNRAPKCFRIIYSGTPENVGPVVKGDVLLCKLDGLPDMSIPIT